MSGATPGSGVPVRKRATTYQALASQRVNGWRLLQEWSSPAWMKQAACAGTSDPDAWHLVRPGAAEYAIRICRGCPVVSECLDFAMADAHLEGVWGATTADQRAATRRRHTRLRRLRRRGPDEQAE